MSARSLMRQRCTIERPVVEGSNQTWKAHLTGQPCVASLVEGADLELLSGWSVPVDKYTVLLPVGTDIKPGDRVSNVADRTETTTVLDGPLAVDTIIRHADHLAVKTISCSGPTNANLLALLAPGALAANGDPGELTPIWEGEAASIIRRVDTRTAAQGREQQEANPRTTLTILDTTSTLPAEAASTVHQAAQVLVEDRSLDTITTRRWSVKVISRYRKNGIGFTVLELDKEASR